MNQQVPDKAQSALTKQATNTCPNRPRLVFRAGFAGRRELSLEEEGRFKTAIEKVFNVLGHQLAALAPGVPIGVGSEPHVSEFYSRQCPLLRLVTGLCEGADALAGQVLETVKIAPDTGATTADTMCLETELAAVLPFSVKDYRDGRPGEYLNEFERQLANCAWVLELDGIYDKPDSTTLESLPIGERNRVKSLADNRRARGYRAQSAFLLRHSDVLIAAADPNDHGKAGGTLETVRAALEFELPVVFIHTGKDSDNIYLIEPEVDLHSRLAGPVPADWQWRSGLRDWVTQLTADPDNGLESTDRKDLPQTHSEKMLSEFFDQASVPPRTPDGKRKLTYRESCWAWFSKRFTSGPRPSRDTVLKPFDGFRSRATELNYHYSGLYRGAFFMNYVLAIVAVTLAAFSLLLLGKGTHTTIGSQVVDIVDASGHAATEVAKTAQVGWLLPVLFVLGTLKLAIVISISLNTRRANSESWNDRAVDFRYLAERLRGMFYLPLAGSHQPPAAAPPQFASRVVRQSTVDWLFDAIIRGVSPADTGRGNQVELPSHDGQNTVLIKQLLKVEPLQVAKAVRDGWIESQAIYHARNSGTMHGMHHWIENVSKWLSWSVIAVVALDLVLIGGKVMHWLPESIVPVAKFATPWLIFISAILPAVVAALGGVSFQAECQRLAERSDVMQAILAGRERRHSHSGGQADAREKAEKGGHWKIADDLSVQIDAAQSDPSTDIGSWSHNTLRLTERVATDFVHEVAEWSVLYAKEVNDPG